MTSSVGYDPQEEDYEPEALTTEDRASTNLRSPDFQKTAPEPEQDVPELPKPADFGTPMAATLPDIQTADAAPVEAPRLKGYDEDVASAIPGLTAPTPHLGIPSRGYDPRAYEQEDRRLAAEDAKSKSGIHHYLRSRGVQMDVAPDGSETVATHEDGNPVFAPSASQPFLADNGRWQVRQRDERGRLNDVDLMGTNHVHTDTDGNRYFTQNGVKVDLNDPDQTVVEAKRVRDQMADLQTLHNAREQTKQQIMADVQPAKDALDRFHQMPVTMEDTGTTASVKRLENLVENLSPSEANGTINDFDKDRLTAAHKGLARFGQETPEYEPAKQAYEGAREQVRSLNIQDLAEKKRKIELAASPRVSAAASSIMGDGRLTPSEDGTVSNEELANQVAATAAERGTSQVSAMAGVLKNMKAHGVQLVGRPGQQVPIDDAIQRAQNPPKATPQEPEPVPPVEKSLWGHLLGTFLNSANQSGAQLTEGIQRAVGADSYAADTAKDVRFAKEVASGQFSPDNPYRPGGPKANEFPQRLVDPSRQKDFVTGLAGGVSDLPVLLANPYVGMSALTAKAASEGGDEAAAEGKSRAIGALKSGGIGAATAVLFGAGGAAARSVMPAISTPLYRAATAAGLHGAVNSVVSAVMSQLTTGNALPQTPAEWGSRIIFDWGFGIHSGIHEFKLPGHIAEAAKTVTDAPGQIQLAQANLEYLNFIGPKLAEQAKNAPEGTAEQYQALIDQATAAKKNAQSFLDAQNPNLVRKVTETAKKVVKASEEPPEEPEGGQPTKPAGPTTPPAGTGGAGGASTESGGSNGHSQAIANHDPDNLGSRAWIAKKVSAGVSREDAVKQWTEGLAAAKQAADALPSGSIVEHRANGIRYVKTSDGWHEQKGEDYSDNSVISSENLRGAKVVRVGPKVEGAPSTQAQPFSAKLRVSDSLRADASEALAAGDQAGFHEKIDAINSLQGELHTDAQAHMAAIPEGARLAIADAVAPGQAIGERQLSLHGDTGFLAAEVGRQMRDHYTTPEQQARVADIASRMGHDAPLSHFVADQHTGLMAGQDLTKIATGETVDPARLDKFTELGLVQLGDDGTPHVTDDAMPLLPKGLRERIKANPNQFRVKATDGGVQDAAAPLIRAGQAHFENALHGREQRVREAAAERPHQVRVEFTDRAGNQQERVTTVAAHNEDQAVAKATAKFQKGETKVTHAEVTTAEKEAARREQKANPNQPEPKGSVPMTRAKREDFTPEQQKAIGLVAKEFHRNSKLFKAIGIDDLEFVRVDGHVSGLSTGDGLLRLDGEKLLAHFQTLESLGTTPEKWVRKALTEEIVHQAQFKAAGPKWRSKYKAIWEDESVPKEMREAAAKAYSGFDRLAPHEKAAELVRMVVQGEWKGSITEQIFKAIKDLHTFLLGIDTKGSPLLQEAIDQTRAVLNDARRRVILERKAERDEALAKSQEPAPPRPESPTSGSPESPGSPKTAPEALETEPAEQPLQPSPETSIPQTSEPPAESSPKSEAEAAASHDSTAAPAEGKPEANIEEPPENRHKEPDVSTAATSEKPAFREPPEGILADSPAGMSAVRHTLSEDIIASAGKTASAYDAPAFIGGKPGTTEKLPEVPRVSRTRPSFVAATVHPDGRVELEDGWYRKGQEPTKKTPPTLGKTGKEIWSEWRGLTGTKVTPRAVVVAQDVLGGGKYHWSGNELMRDVSEKQRDGSYIALSRPATKAEIESLNEATDMGALQIEEQRITGAGGVHVTGGAGKTLRVLHQATGKPLPEFLDTDRGKAWLKRDAETQAIIEKNRAKNEALEKAQEPSTIAPKEPAAASQPDAHAPGSAVRLGKNPSVWTVGEKLPPQKGDLPDEAFYKVTNDKGDSQVVEAGDMTPVALKDPAEKAAAKARREAKDADLDRRLANAKMAPSVFPDAKSKREALKRAAALKKGKGGLHASIAEGEMIPDIPPPRLISDAEYKEYSRLEAMRGHHPDEFAGANARRHAELLAVIRARNGYNYARTRQRGQVKDGHTYRDPDFSRSVSEMVPEEALMYADSKKERTPTGIASHIGMFFDPEGGQLEEQFSTPQKRAETEKDFGGAREVLREKFGDTVTLYRAESKGSGPRNIFSYSFSKPIAERHARDEGRKIVKAEVPLDAVVWTSNEGGEQEALVDRRLIAKSKADIGAADNLRASYQSEVARTGFPSVSIGELAQRAGIPMDAMKAHVLDEWRKGNVVLSKGDWSLSNEATRAGAVEAAGDRYLGVRWLEKPGDALHASAAEGVREVPFNPDIEEAPEGAKGYRVKSKDVTATVAEYPDHIYVHDIVSADPGKGDVRPVLRAIKAKGKPVELTVGRRSGDTDAKRLEAFYSKLGFEPVDGRPGRMRYEPDGDSLHASKAQRDIARTITNVSKGEYAAHGEMADKVTELRDKLTQSVSKAKAYIETLRKAEKSGEAGRKAGDAAAREEINTADRWLTADVHRVREDLVGFAKGFLPPEERGHFLSQVASVLADRPSLIGGDPTGIYRDAFKLMGKIQARGEQVYRNGVAANIQKIAARALKSPSVDVNVKKLIAGLKNPFLFAKLSPAKRAELESRKKALEAQRAAGKVTIPAAAIAELSKLSQKHISELPTAALEALRDRVEALETLGRLSVKRRERIYGDEVQKIKGAIVGMKSTPFENRPENADLPPLKQGEKYSMTAMQRLVNSSIKVSNWAARMGRHLMPMDPVIDMLGEGKGAYDGPLFRHVRGPLDLDYNAKQDELRGFTEGIDEIVKRNKLTGPDSHRIGLLAAANQEGGMERLVKAGIPQDRIDAVIKSLTPGEMEAYRYMRNAMDSTMPRLKATMRELYNQDVTPVKDYFPMVRDWNEYKATQDLPKPIDPASGEPVGQDELATWKNVVEDARPTARTNAEKGFTIDRQKGAATPIRIDAIEVFKRHMDDVLHLIHTQRDIKQIGEVMRSPEAAEKLGRAGRQIMVDWLDTLARNGGAEANSHVAMIDWLRKHSSVGLVSWRAVSQLKHVSNAALAVHHVGPGWYLKGLMNVHSADAQAFMQHNMAETFNRHGGEMAMEEASKISKIANLGFAGARFFDRYNAQASALGYYFKDMASKGFTAEQALKADVRNTQRGGSPSALDSAAKTSVQDALVRMRRIVASPAPKDAPQFLSRGSGIGGNVSVSRSLLQFGTVFLDRWSNIRHDLYGAGIKKKQYGQASTIALGLLAAVAAESGIVIGMRNLANAATGNHPKEEEGFVHEFLTHAMKQVPFLGQMMSAYAHGGTGIPVIDSIGSTGQAIHRTFNAKSGQSQASSAIRAAGGLGAMVGVPGAGQVSDLASKLVSGKEENTVQRVMRENGIKHTPEKTPGVPERKDIVSAVRNKSSTPVDAFRGAVKAGMKPQQARSAIQEAQKPADLVTFEHLPLKTAIEVFAKLNADPSIPNEQKRMYRQALQKKHAVAKQST